MAVDGARGAGLTGTIDLNGSHGRWPDRGHSCVVGPPHDSGRRSREGNFICARALTWQGMSVTFFRCGVLRRIILY